LFTSAKGNELAKEYANRRTTVTEQPELASLVEDRPLPSAPAKSMALAGLSPEEIAQIKVRLLLDICHNLTVP
jgi:hypothetical protein